MNKLIINADDFGYTKEVNSSIIEAHSFGTVTSTTIMCNENAFDHAIAIYPKSLGIGVHLNLTWGKALSTGQPFNKYNKFKAVLGTLNKHFVETEFRKQIEKLLEVGIRPDHLDSHQHLHAFPPMKKTVIELAKEYHIYKIRWQKEKQTKILFNSSFLNQKILNLHLGKAPLKTTDHFFGVLYTGDPKIEHFISYLNFKGTAEICCHPGKKSFSSQDKLQKTRQKELEILTSKQFLQAIKEKNIQLINFKEL